MHERDNTAAKPPEDSTRLADFIQALGAEGRAVVSSRALPAAGEDAGAMAVLSAIELRARQELAGNPPPLSGPAAVWAARLFYEACRCAVCRDLSTEHVTTALSAPCPVARGPETDWSVDLMFRHLPALFRFARQLSNGDPLVNALKNLAATWPLSAVGLPGLTKGRLATFIEHPVLRRLYADRLAAAEDPGPLDDPRVRGLLRMDLGLHPELAPRLAVRLDPKATAPDTVTTAFGSSSPVPPTE